MSDEELQKNHWSGLVEFVLKHQDIRDLSSFLEILLPWIHQLATKKPRPGLFLGKVVLQYVLNDINANDVNLFIEKANHHLSGKLQGDIMTLAQELEQRGIEKGMRQGIQQGEVAFLKRLLEHRFKHLPLEYQQRIEQADPN